MNWVSPIKDEETLEKYKEVLKEMDLKYYIMFEIGLGTGMQLQEILKLKNKDVYKRASIETEIGTKKIKRSLAFSPQLQKIMNEYTEGKDPEGYLIMGQGRNGEALSREQAYRALKSAGKKVGLTSIGAQTMRKTFAWRYYKESGDIYYLQNLLNHASPSITYRYIGEKPNVEVVMKKMTSEENERSRMILLSGGRGAERIDAITGKLDEIKKELSNPGNPDAYYGRVECLLDEMEELIRSYETTK